MPSRGWQPGPFALRTAEGWGLFPITRALRGDAAARGRLLGVGIFTVVTPSPVSTSEQTDLSESILAGAATDVVASPRKLRAPRGNQASDVTTMPVEPSTPLSTSSQDLWALPGGRPEFYGRGGGGVAQAVVGLGPYSHTRNRG